MNILGIESSCDDTSIGIVRNGIEILSLYTISQNDAHKLFQGVVPEIASREHLKSINIVCETALKKINYDFNKIDTIAVTTYPGLIGSLVVGLNFAKGLAYRYNKPLIPINHLIAHFYSAFFENNINFPFLGLLISGGHTALFEFESFTKYKIIGKTIDDSCGEAFDKIAKYFNLGYPGGPIIDKLAQKGDPLVYKFPIALIDLKKYGLNFSFSGIKTAVINFRKKYKVIKECEKNNEMKNKKENLIGKDNPNNKISISQKIEGYIESEENIYDILASFQYIIAKTLLLKTKHAIEKTKINKIVITGGSAANSEIRKQFINLKKDGVEIYFPPMNLCSDNGAMVAGLAYHLIKEYDFNYDQFLQLDAKSKIFEMKRNSMII